MPYSLEHPEESGLNAADLKRFKLGAPLPVRYEAGVFLADGQHKGAMLRTLIHKTGRRVRAVVFVDNDARHCDRVQNAFADQGLEVVTFRYSREDENSRRFNEGDKTQVSSAWRKLHSSLKEVFR